MHPRACAIQRAVVAVEICHGSQKRQELVLAGRLPAVEICTLGDVRRTATVWRTRRARAERAELPDLHRCTQIRVPAVNFHLILAFATSRRDNEKKAHNKELLEQQQPNERGAWYYL